ncbi:hypothetical protein [Hyphomicrobium sp. DY-1]|uniref:hypothetical protein n=1 Tax=Hyphomicrobium sp. DY-1 TaxID=3075650 RepID=UPI0039C2C3E2
MTSQCKTAGPWFAEGPDEFGDFNIHHPADRLAVAAVVSNLRPPSEVAANAAFIVRAENSFQLLIEALEDAKAHIEADLAEHLLCCSVIRDGVPDRSTMRDEDVERAAYLEGIISRAHDALTEASK